MEFDVLSKNKKEGLTKEDIKILSLAYKKLAERAVFLYGKELDEVLFSSWEEAVHLILKRHGCPCQSGNKDKCFLSFSRETKVRLVSGNETLNFVKYVSRFVEQREIAFSEIQN